MRNNFEYSSKDGITSARWERMRQFVLSRDCYLDQVARRYGKRIEATQVHHIFPREYFPRWTFEPWNCISVSTKTHDKLHDRTSHKLTADGWALLVRTARQNGIEIAEGWRELLTNI